MADSRLNTRRALLKSIPAATAAVVLPVLPTMAAEAEAPLDRMERLAGELGKALDGWLDVWGSKMEWTINVYPASTMKGWWLQNMDAGPAMKLRPEGFENVVPDAEIFRLVGEYEKVNAEVKRLGKIFDHYETIYYDGVPKRPVWNSNDHVPKWTDDTTIGEIKSETSLAAYGSVWKTAQADWQVAKDQFRIDCGLAAAEEPYNAAVRKAAALVDDILEAPARTPQGMLAKIRLGTEWGEKGDVLDSLTADLARLAGKAVAS